MRNKKVTIVCCYNDSGQYKRLKESLAKQNVEYDLIGIDNREQQFTSCSRAFNSVINEVRTEFVIYSHQDIELPEADMLERFTGYLEQIEKGDILGVAGAVEKPDPSFSGPAVVLSNVRHGKELKAAGEADFTGVVKCDTVDECFFGGAAEWFFNHPFDEKLCDGWHLYAVERCLDTRKNGNHVYVCDVPLIHYSAGRIDHAYNLNFLKLAERYRKEMTWIRTVCGSSLTDFWHRIFFYLKREVLIALHRY